MYPIHCRHIHLWFCSIGTTSRYTLCLFFYHDVGKDTLCLLCLLRPCRRYVEFDLFVKVVLPNINIVFVLLFFGFAVEDISCVCFVLIITVMSKIHCISFVC